MQGGFKRAPQVDRFGQTFMLCGLKDKEGKGFPKGYCTIGGKDFKFEVTPANKEGVEYWLRITKVKARPKAESF
jgi:hypothetical protein